MLQPGEERRRTGSHYTPRSLTEKVVKRTLEPLLACLGPERTAEQILQLKICDPAMGSGAFLVAACRELAIEIEAAWTRAGLLERIIEQHGDARLHARRLVAQRCLYGVDKNPAAVELAKLSLWLITLSKTLPFTFVDHALRQGDSLVGLDFRQIKAFHWQPQQQLDFCESILTDALSEAIAQRQAILELAERDDAAAQSEKRRLLEFSQQAIERVRLVADACVGAFFAETKDAAREKERQRRQSLIQIWLGSERHSQDESLPEHDREQSGAAAQNQRAAIEQLADDARKKLTPFHWWLEFPEVFFEERPDPLQGGAVNGAALMEGVVGNPPFLGGRMISGEHGDTYADWLFMMHGHSKNADLSAHFFRRSAQLIGEHGAFGLVATNTISQGDTRNVGLGALANQNWKIFDAVNSMPWPGSAVVTVSLVHASHGNTSELTRSILDGQSTATINSQLRNKPERSNPVALSANAACTFQGSIVRGDGFVIGQPERDALVTLSNKNEDRISPYLGGEEINTSPTQAFHRYVINFGEMSLEKAAAWPDLLEITKQRVKPERDRTRDAQGYPWWQLWRPRNELYAALAPLRRCFVNSQVSKHLVFALQPTDRVFGHTLYVYPLPAFSSFAVLQSRIHAPWAWLLSSSMKTDLRYSASDCFETFPFPNPDPRSVIPELEAIGQQLYEARAHYMIDANQGLTKTYNALKNPGCDEPRILELRRLHQEMDRAVLNAYGWGDIAVPPYCPRDEEEKGLVSVFEDEVIDRLYLLNSERAREEERLGMGVGGKGKAKDKKKSAARVEADRDGESTELGLADGGAAPKASGNKTGRAKKNEPQGQGSLF